MSAPRPVLIKLQPRTHCPVPEGARASDFRSMPSTQYLRDHQTSRQKVGLHIHNETRAQAHHLVISEQEEHERRQLDHKRQQVQVLAQSAHGMAWQGKWEGGGGGGVSKGGRRVRTIGSEDQTYLSPRNYRLDEPPPPFSPEKLRHIRPYYPPPPLL